MLSIKDCINSAIDEYPMDKNNPVLVDMYEIHELFILGNKSLIKQVLWNLLKNALYQIQSHHRGCCQVNV